MDAAFSGAGGWVLQGATLTLAGAVGAGAAGAPAIDEAGNLTISSGTIAASGGIDVESASGAIVTVLGGGEINAEGISIGTDAGQSGALMLGGAGTSVQDTGAGGSLQIGGGGTGRVSITDGANVTDAAVDTLGGAIGGTGELDVSVGGDLDDLGLIVGDGGIGSLSIGAGGTVVSDPGAPGDRRCHQQPVRGGRFRGERDRPWARSGR